MQTKLRNIGFAVVASLLSIIPMFAGSQGAKVQSKHKDLKTRYVGTASWYGAQHQGRKMANGKRFDRRKLTAASWYFPLGTTIRVVNVKNGESVIVTITDRGPNLRLHRILDLSQAAAERLDYVGEGLTPVFLYPVPPFETQAARFDTGLIDTPASQISGDYQAKAVAVPM
ncbi:MAG TPA: septal ring lytic transglycosylase RlpA family protein [Candidatus Acidoferrales bacterium]|jgi:rare lipoprotein A|nr:septal ring lytic transglycosylase RlpA family protein [Candidatus Acidoferrales bacterium]